MKYLIIFNMLLIGIILYGAYDAHQNVQQQQHIPSFSDSCFRTGSLDYCMEYVAPLHRPVDSLTNWGQGKAPAANVCPPGTLRFDTDDGLFLECMRGTS